MSILKKISCPDCGYRNSASSVVCSHCGVVLSADRPVEEGSCKQMSKIKYWRETFRFLTVSQHSGEVIRVPKRGKYRGILVILGYSLPYVTIPLFLTFLPNYLAGLLAAMISGILGTLLGRISGLHVMPGKGFSVTRRGVPIRILYRDVSGYSVGDTDGTGKIEISLRNVDEPIILEIESGAQFRKLSGLLQNNIVRSGVTAGVS